MNAEVSGEQQPSADPADSTRAEPDPQWAEVCVLLLRGQPSASGRLQETCSLTTAWQGFGAATPSPQRGGGIHPVPLGTSPLLPGLNSSVGWDQNSAAAI